MQRYPLTNTRLASCFTRSRAQIILLGARHDLVLGQWRHNSNFSRDRPKSTFSHFVPGLVWGGGVGVGCLVVVCGVYYLAGWKEKVDLAHKTLVSVNETIQSTKSTTKKATDFLESARGAVKTSIAAVVPFGSKFTDPLVDKAFDSVEENIDAHGEEAKVIIVKMMDDIQAAIDKHKTWPMAAATEVVTIVKRETAKLHELSTRPETQEKISMVKQVVMEKSQEGLQHVKGLVSQENVERLTGYVGQENIDRATGVGRRITEMIWNKDGKDGQ